MKKIYSNFTRISGLALLGFCVCLGAPTAQAEAVISEVEQIIEGKDGTLLAVDPVAFFPVSDDIIVSATRSEQFIEEVGSSVSVISAEAIENFQFQFVADALGLAPGVSLSRNSAFGGVSSINLRGAASRQTLVLIDGIVVNDPSSPGGAFNFANLDNADVERIEVLRGPQSILYGSEAIGGVIAITTKRGTQNKGINIFAEGGSFGRARAGLGLGGDSGRFDYRVSVFGIRTDGISRADIDDGNSERDGFRSIATSANIGFEVSDDIRLESFFRYGASETEFDGFPPPNFSLSDSDDEDSVEELAVNGRLLANFFDNRFTNQLTIGFSDIQRTNFSGDFITFDGEGERFSTEYLGNFAVSSDLSLSFGAELEETSIDTGDIIEDVGINGFFGLAQWRLDDAVKIGSLSVSGGVRHDDHETFGGVTTTRFTGAFSPNFTDVIIRGSWGEGFSAPSLFQLNFVFGAGLPNRDLQPEESRGFDIGFEKNFGDGFASLSATYFNSNIRNLIDFNFATGAFFNVNEARQRGVETQLTLKPHAKVQLSSAYTYTDSVDLADGLQVIRQPRHRLVSNIQWQTTQNLDLSLGVTYNGRERDFGGDVDAFVRVDLRGSYRINNHIEFFGRVENLTDSNYQDVLGFGEPGISAFAGFRFR